MKAVRFANLGAVVVAVCSFSLDALAENWGTTGCLGRSDVLGISRVVEIDTRDGPRFGQQYEENQFLEDGEVVLTFDDGPIRRFTEPILHTLDTHCVKATFFAVGRMAVADPSMLRDVHRRGHTVASHTWSHQNLGQLSSGVAKREVELGLSAVAKALDAPVAPFFRFPYLRDPKSVQGYLQQRHIGIFGIDVDSRDFETSSGERVRDNVLSILAEKRKGIILFHDIQRSTARGLDGLLEALKTRGFKIVHMVPKSAATTLADYDAIAEKLLAKSAVAKGGATPSPDGPAVWPAASGVGQTGDSVAENDSPSKPWDYGGANSGSAAASQRSRETHQFPEDRWQIRSMGR